MYSIKYYILFILIDYVQTYIEKFPFDTVVAFSDAHTDTGNVYDLTNHQWPLVPPYYQGRFTNGPVWIEQLNILNIINMAYGDATIDNDNLITGFTGPNDILVPGIRQQIVCYLGTHDIGAIDLSETLYIIWASGSEYRTNSSLSADIVVQSLLTTVYDLLVIGIEHLIIMNLLPLHLFPGNDQDERLSTLIIEHNNYLLSNITKIQNKYSKISIEIFDLYSLITNILTNNSMYTFNKTDKCWDISNNIIYSQCINPNEYVFIDNYHFTSSIHQIIADKFHQFILSSPSFSSSLSRTFSFSKFYIFMSIILCLININIKS